MSMKTIAAAVAITLSFSVAATAPADAATAKVSISKIGTKKVAYKKSTTVKPRVKEHGQVKVSSKKLTVKKGKKTVAKSKSSVRLKAGTYKVKTTVKYRVYKYKTTNVVAIKAGKRVYADYYDRSGPVLTSCSVTSVDVDTYSASCKLSRTTTTRVEVSSDDIETFESNVSVGDTIYPDWIIAPTDIYAHKTARSYGKTRTMSRTQALKIKQGAKPRGCARKSDFNKVKNGQSKSRVASLMGGKGKQYFYSSPIEGREYKPCDKDQYMTVSFEDGYVYDKTFFDFG